MTDVVCTGRHATWARRWPAIATMLIFAVVAVANVVWVYEYRRALPLDVDEAGYLGFAFDDLRGLRGGLGILFDTVVGQRQFGPLVPLTAAPLLGVFGENTQVAMAVQVVFLAVLTFASYGLGARLAGRGAGVVSACVVLLAPGVLDFSRTFHFVIAPTALLALAVWALVASDGLARRGLVVTAGIAVGLLLLARTYAVAFLPGLARTFQ